MCFVQKTWSWKSENINAFHFWSDQVFSMFPSYTKKKKNDLFQFGPIFSAFSSSWPRLVALVTKLKPHSQPKSVCGYNFKHSTEITLVSLNLCSCNRMWRTVYHTYTCTKHIGLLCFLLLNNSTCWQRTLKGRSVTAEYVNGYVFTLAFMHGFFLASSALDVPQLCKYRACSWPENDYFFPKKDKEGALRMYGRDCNRTILW